MALFGSLARNELHEKGDIDVFVVTKDLPEPKNHVARRRHIYGCLTRVIDRFGGRHPN